MITLVFLEGTDKLFSAVPVEPSTSGQEAKSQLESAKMTSKAASNKIW